MVCLFPMCIYSMDSYIYIIVSCSQDCDLHQNKKKKMAGSLVDGIVILMLQQLVLVVSFMVIKYSSI